MPQCLLCWPLSDNCHKKSQGQVFDSCPCITWQMPVLLFFLVLLGIFVRSYSKFAKIQLISTTSKSFNSKMNTEPSPVHRGDYRITGLHPVFCALDFWGWIFILYILLFIYYYVYKYLYIYIYINKYT